MKKYISIKSEHIFISFIDKIIEDLGIKVVVIFLWNENAQFKLKRIYNKMNKLLIDINTIKNLQGAHIKSKLVHFITLKNRVLWKIQIVLIFILVHEDHITSFLFFIWV